MDKPKILLKPTPIFLFLLSIFFVWHGFVENYPAVPVIEALKLTALYISISLLFVYLAWLFYRNLYKATLIVFSLMAFNFFFGSTFDFLKKHFANTIIVKYSFILPLIFIVLIVLIIYFKKTKRTFSQTTKYLNWLFIVLILFDSIVLTVKFTQTKGNYVADFSNQLHICDTCSKPDIYLIIADEYAGNRELKDLFSYNNIAFENELKKRGFHIINNSRANYNGTMYSMASMLSMDYLKNLKGNTINNHDMYICSELINQNNLIRFLTKEGYTFYNNSIFDFNDKPKLVSHVFFPSKKSLITSQTFINRIYHDLGFYLITQGQIDRFRKQSMHNNIKVDSLTKNIASTANTTAKFVYAHFIMPHFPYYFDSTGKTTPIESLVPKNKPDKKAYIGYLVTANRKFLDLVDHIFAVSKRPPVIVLMGDHGFRQFLEKVDQKYYFMNLNAVFLPNGIYSGFYDGMSNINQFRVILNSQFGQKLCLLKDSTIFLNE